MFQNDLKRVMFIFVQHKAAWVQLALIFNVIITTLQSYYRLITLQLARYALTHTARLDDMISINAHVTFLPHCRGNTLTNTIIIALLCSGGIWMTATLTVRERERESQRCLFG